MKRIYLIILCLVSSVHSFASETIVGDWDLVEKYCAITGSGESALEPILTVAHAELVRSFDRNGKARVATVIPSVIPLGSSCPGHIDMDYSINEGSTSVSFSNSEVQFDNCWAISVILGAMRLYNNAPPTKSYEINLHQDTLLIIHSAEDFDCGGENLRLVEKYKRRFFVSWSTL